MATSSARPRQPFLDVLKGMAIFWVVMGHVIAFQIRGLDHAFLFKIIGTVHMPLFFFISGWLSFKAAGIDIFSGKALWKRFKRLVVPMVAVSSLWVLYFPKSGLQSPLPPGFDGLWCDGWKNGYWFTLVLFAIFIIFGAIQPLLLRCKRIGATVGAIAAVSAVIYFIYSILPAQLSSILCAELIAHYLPLFLLGWACRRYSDEFKAFWLSSKGVTIAMILLVPTFYMITWAWEFPWMTSLYAFILAIVARFCIAVIGFACVIPWTEKAPTGRAVALWSLLGRKSLSIYLLHYFFLFPMGFLKPYLLTVNTALVPMALVAVVSAALIVAAVLLVDYILSYSKPLSLILTGNE